MKLTFWAWSLALAAIAGMYYEIAIPLIAVATLLSGACFGYRDGRRDAAEMLRNEFRKGSKLL